MSGEDIVLEFQDVWKRFPAHRNTPGFKEFLVALPRKLMGQKTNADYFSAIQGMSLQVHKGECLGIIGRNGAGKSTLLSLMLGGVEPSSGKVIIKEKVTPLLELGAGFHPDLTGRENVVLNAVMLGLTRAEALKRVEQIVEFSEIGEFADRPSRTYSSGMYMRLAFSVAMHTDPQLMLIDEVLAVGDEAFQEKSSRAIRDMIDRGVTTVIVSHNMATVKSVCSRLIFINRGEIKAEGDPDMVIDRYMELSHRK